jgi:Zn-dependent M28 family amino/carboxypeptidase
VGLQPAAGGWYQSFTVAKEAPVAQSARVGGLVGKNVIGLLPGHDPGLRNETVIVGAHYDHLGLGGFGSLDPDSTGKVHNGADDNASGAAMLIHLAGRLAQSPPARTVLFIAFSGEELGLLGSAHYVRQPVYPLSSTMAMINLDMVGRLRNGRLIIYGAQTAKEFPALLDSLNWHAGFDLKAQGDGYGPSDQSSFYAAGRPVLHVFTDLHGDYHRTTDDWQKIDPEGFRRVANFTMGVVTALANRRARLTPVEVEPPAHSTATAMSAYGTYLGTIPDMTDNPGGVRLLGVRAGSPAERAGLRGDDIITRIGDLEIPDLQAMTNALRSHEPGDTVSIVIRRGNQVTTVRATLGTRGG